MNDKDYLMYSILKDNGFIIPKVYQKFENMKEVEKDGRVEKEKEKVSKIPTVSIQPS